MLYAIYIYIYIIKSFKLYYCISL